MRRHVPAPRPAVLLLPGAILARADVAPVQHAGGCHVCHIAQASVGAAMTGLLPTNEICLNFHRQVLWPRGDLAQAGLVPTAQMRDMDGGRAP